MDLTAKELEDQGLLRELAKIFRREDTSDGLLASIGLPPESRPPHRAYANSLTFWQAAAELIENGATPGGLEALLTAASSQFPYNRHFAPWRGGPPFRVQLIAPAGDMTTAPATAPPVATPPKARAAGQWAFLCHASEDKPKVREIRDKLKADGMNPWLDEAGLDAGIAWREKIEQTLQESYAVVACLSRTSTEKVGFVQSEIRMALKLLDLRPEGRIFLIPARIEECNLPAKLRDLQAVDLFRNDGYDRLLRSLRLCRGQP